MKLSVIIPSCNDHEELRRTIASLKFTAKDAEIVVVDDASGNPVNFIIPPEELEGVKVVINKFRLGVGPSRHIGAQHATGDWILLCDSHMRFPKGWYELAMVRLGRDRSTHTLYCGVMLGLDATHQDLDHPKQVYHGATINFAGPDRQANQPGKIQVMEAVWNEKEQPDDGEIVCPMGASYFCQRHVFLKLDPLKYLMGWGSDEVMLGLKWWLSGGDVRLLKPVRIGHVYREQKEKKFVVPLGHPTYNKLFAIHTLLPVELAVKMTRLLMDTTSIMELNEAKRLMKENWAIFESERLRNAAMFKLPVKDLALRFGLQLPN